jgi:hypothetical protein
MVSISTLNLLIEHMLIVYSLNPSLSASKLAFNSLKYHYIF